MKTKKFFEVMALTAVLAMFAVLSLAECSESTPPEVAVYSSIDLYAQSWDAFVTDDGYRVDGGSLWYSDNNIKLSDFTTVKPKKDDVFKFKVSGISNKELDNVYFQLSWRKVHGGSQRIDLPEVFSDYIFELGFGEVDVIGDNYFCMYCDMPVPAGTPNGAVMATISNFSISLVEDGIPSKSRFGDFEYEKASYWDSKNQKNIECNRIIKYVGTGGNITIPSEIKGVPVIIGDGVFQNCTSLTGVTIENGVKGIGASAFQGCTGLTGITIPSSVTSIGSKAFRGCTGLISVAFQGTPSIGDSAFPGDLQNKYNGTPGTYTRTSGSDEWTSSE